MELQKLQGDALNSSPDLTNNSYIVTQVLRT